MSSNTTSTFTLSTSATGTSATITAVPTGVSVRRLWCTDRVLDQFLKGRFPQGVFHINPDCGLIRKQRGAVSAIDVGSIRQSWTRTDNWFLLMHGEAAGRICERCARSLVNDPGKFRDEIQKANYEAYKRGKFPP